MLTYDVSYFTDIICRNSYLRQNFIILDTIYETNNKIIYKIRDRSDSNIYVLRISFLKNSSTKVYDLLIQNKNINVENIISYKIDGNLIFVKSHYIEGYDLSKMDSSRFTNIMLINILNGLIHLHNLNIIHMDIKLQNIMYDIKKGICVIIDFDSSVICDNIYYSNELIGTNRYICPESISDNIYSTKSDIWSLGICLKIISYRSDISDTLLTKDYDNRPSAEHLLNRCIQITE